MVNTSDILPNTPRYLKVPLIFFNCILWILGVILIALGGYVLSQLDNLTELTSISLPSGLIVLGVFIIILTVIGCVVAYKEKLVGLIFFTIFMLILLVCLIGVGGGAFAYRNKAATPLSQAWGGASDQQRNFVQNYFTSQDAAGVVVPCCGWTRNGNNVPLQPGSHCVINATLGIYQPWPPCENLVVSFVQKNLYIAGSAGVAIGVIEFICMLFSLFLIVRLCRNPRSRSYD